MAGLIAGHSPDVLDEYRGYRRRLIDAARTRYVRERAGKLEPVRMLVRRRARAVCDDEWMFRRPQLRQASYPETLMHRQLRIFGLDALELGFVIQTKSAAAY